jgi:hypothetical protein
VKLSLGQKAQAIEDLRRASQFAKDADEALKSKISAMLAGLGRK